MEPLIIFWIVIGGWTLIGTITYLLLAYDLFLTDKDNKGEYTFAEYIHETEDDWPLTICSIIFPMGLFFFFRDMGERYMKENENATLNPIRLILKIILKRKYIREKTMKEI